jgi:hypothetical protein
VNGTPIRLVNEVEYAGGNLYRSDDCQRLRACKEIAMVREIVTIDDMVCR